jgi:hypothetical protein
VGVGGIGGWSEWTLPPRAAESTGRQNRAALTNALNENLDLLRLTDIQLLRRIERNSVKLLNILWCGHFD